MADSDDDDDDLGDADLAAEIARLQREVGEVFPDRSDSDEGPSPPARNGPARQGYSGKPASDTQLQRLLQQKDAEIAELRALLGTGKGAVETLKEQKYLDALKKVRHLTVQLEKERKSNSKLTQQLVGLEKQLLEAQTFNVLPSGGGEAASVMPGSEEDLQRQCQNAKTKLDKANKVVEQLRRQVQDMGTETKKLRQVLAKEVGEDHVDKALDEGSGWRGRAQLISLLRAKVKQLQRTVAAASAAAPSEAGPPGDDDISEHSGNTGFTGATGFTAATRRDHNDAHVERLERMQATRAKEIADLTLLVASKDKDIKDLREKVEALQARSVNLEKYGADLKMKLHRVIAKTENDDKLMEMYRQELTALKKASAAGAAPPRTRTPPGRAPPSLDAGTEEVQNLKAELASTKQKLADALYTQMAARSAESPDSAAPTRLRFAEVEVEKLRDLVRLLREQLTVEADRHAATAAHLRTERQKTAGLERALGKDGGPVLKPGPEDRTVMLREENRSLKEQLLAVHQSHAHEVAAYQEIVDKLKASGGGAAEDPPSRGSRNGQGSRGGSGAGGSAAEEELRELQKQYAELRGMYNALALKQGR